jgi:hypothetical protein
MSFYKKLLVVCLSFSLLLIAGCSSSSIVDAERALIKQPPYAVALTNTLTSMVSSQYLSPTSASRIYAYTFLAAREGFLVDNKVEDAVGASVIVAKELFFDVPALVKELDTLLYRYNTSNISEVSKEVAKKVILKSREDGYAQGVYTFKRVEPNEIYGWESTGMLRMPFLDPDFGKVKLASGSESCDIPPVDYQRVEGEVREMFDNFSYENAASDNVLLFLAGSATPTPPGQMLLISSNLAVRSKLSEEESLTFLSTVAMAVFEAGVSVWREKDEHGLARPETLYRKLTGKEVLLPRETPAHPAYPSGHSGFSGAAMEVIERFFGKDVELIASAPEDLAAPSLVVKFSSPSDLMKSVNKSRVDAGFHYPLDVEMGERLGRCVGGKVYEYLEGGKGL